MKRRKREFLLMTKEDFAERTAPKVGEPKPFVSAWEALGGPDMELFDVDFPRSKSKGRAAKF